MIFVNISGFSDLVFENIISVCGKFSGSDQGVACYSGLHDLLDDQNCGSITTQRVNKEQNSVVRGVGATYTHDDCTANTEALMSARVSRRLAGGEAEWRKKVSSDTLSQYRRRHSAVRERTAAVIRAARHSARTTAAVLADDVPASLQDIPPVPSRR